MCGKGARHVGGAGTCKRGPGCVETGHAGGKGQCHGETVWGNGHGARDDCRWPGGVRQNAEVRGYALMKAGTCE